MLSRFRDHRFITAVCITFTLLVAAFWSGILHATATSGNATMTLLAEEPVGSSPRSGIVTHSFNYSQGFSNGTSAGQVNRAFSSAYTTAASGSETIDVRSFTDADGTSSVSMAKVVCVVIDNSAGTTTLNVGNGTDPLLFFATSAAYLNPVEAGGVLMKCLNSGYTTGTGAKDLKITNTSGSTAANFKVFILGRSS